MYNGGSVVKHRELGYIKGLDVFEEIAAALPADDEEEVDDGDLEID